MIPLPDVKKLDLTRSIEDAIQLEIERAVKTAVDNAKAELTRRVPEIVAGLAIRIMQRVSMESLRDELIIHVRMDNTKGGA